MSGSDSDSSVEDVKARSLLILNDTNWATWEMRTMQKLKGEGLWEYITGEEPKPVTTINKGDGPLSKEELKTAKEEAKELKTWNKENGKAQNIILERLTDGFVRTYCQDKATAKDLWEAVKKQAASPGQHAKMLAFTQLVTPLGPNDSLRTWLQRFQDAADRLSALGAPMPDIMLALLVLHNLPTEDWRAFKSQLTVWEDAKFKFSEVAQAVRSEHLMRRAGDSYAIQASNNEKALYSAGKAKGRSQSKAKSRQSSSSSSKGERGRPHGSKYDPDITCEYCRKIGHSKSQCYEIIGYPVGHPKHAANKPQKSAGRHANIAAEYDSDEDNALLACESIVTVTDTMGKIDSADQSALALLATLPPTDSNVFIVDSGATNTYCADARLFSSLVPISGTYVGTANGQQIDITGMGELNTNFPPLVGNSRVRCVPGLHHNLISVKAVTRCGFLVDFNEEHCYFRTKEGKLVGAGGIGKSGLYEVRIYPRHTAADKALVASSNSAQDAHVLWHQRTGHLHAAGLSFWSAQGMAIGAPSLSPITAQQLNCDTCAITKAARKPFPPKASRRATRPLELVHADLAGPFEQSLSSGFQYYLLVVDDFSRLRWVKCMRSKAETLAYLMEYVAWANNQHSDSGYRVKALRSDNGGEFTSNALTAFLVKEGITHELTTAYTPQQNGVVERANRTVMESARSMRRAANLPLSYWSAAVRAAVHLQNCLPTSALGKISPYQAFYGRPPDCTRWRRFGCMAFVRVPPAKRRGKLDDRAVKCIFIGYPLGSKAWDFWDPNAKRSIRSRDAEFREMVNGLDDCNANAGGAQVPASPRQSAQTSGSSSVDTADSETDSNSDSDHSNQSERDNNRESKSEVVGRDYEDDKGNDPIESDSSGNSNAAQPSEPTTPMPVRRSARANSALPQPSPLKLAGRFARELADFNRPGEKDKAPSMVQLGLLSQESALLVQDDLADQRIPSATLLTSDDLACDLALLTQAVLSDDPISLSEAMLRSDAHEWKQALATEHDSLHKAGTWGEPVERPKGANVVGCKYVLTIKRNPDLSISKYKVRLVARGFTQRYGIDYTETYSPVAAYPSIRMFLALVAHFDLELHQMDVKSAYLHGKLQETIYMEQPEGYAQPGKEHLVLKLNKSLYGLKQAGRTWNEEIDRALCNHGFQSLDADRCLYIRRVASSLIIISLYVDDLLLASDSLTELSLFKRQLAAKFEMQDLGEASFVLGIEIKRDRATRTLSISQGAYTRTLLQRHQMAECNKAPTPLVESVKLCGWDGQATPEETRQYQTLIGGIMWAAIITRPDLAYAASRLSQYASNPSEQHIRAARHVLRYMRGTPDRGIVYRGTGPKNEPPTLVGYCDSDWAQDLDTRRSTTGYCFLLCRAVVSWQSKRQKTVALSSVEAEYMATTQATKEAIWWRRFLTALGWPPGKPILLLSDSQGSIALAKNGGGNHARVKHIDLQSRFVTEQCERGTITLHHVGTQEMAADILTKGLARIKHEVGVRMLGMTPLEGAC